MEVGVARGWGVWPVDNEQWAWRAWNHIRSFSGTEDTEIQAQQAVARALEQLQAEAAAASPDRRVLPASDPEANQPHPQA